jgi:flagellar basal body P-ring formation protein FlgA
MHWVLGMVGTLGIALFQGAVFAAAHAQPEVHSVTVPRTVIYGGDVIAEDSLVEKSLSALELSRSGALARRGDLVGKVARRTLLPGQPIPTGAVRAADVIRQGRPTTAVFEAGGLSISGTVVPLQSAAAGDMLSFQNAESGAVLRGIAQQDGTIRVGPP